MIRAVETVIVGGGQAGLAVSRCLAREGREHVVLERAAAPGNTWRTDRWDSFTLVTPNWTLRLPDAGYNGADPDGYLPRDEIVSILEQYATRFQLPVQYNTRVTAVDRDDGRDRYRVTTEGASFEARNVVSATGLFQQPRLPAAATGLPPDVLQLPAGQYRHPGALPPGAVLVVGSAQSGCQIAEELYQAGRRVCQCVGSAGRVPRRYRGRDIFDWLVEVGYKDTFERSNVQTLLLVSYCWPLQHYLELFRYV